MKRDILFDVLFDHQVQELMDNFTSVIHAHVSFFGPDGKILRQGRDEGNCRFCRMIQSKCLDRCHAMDREKQYLAKESCSCQSYICHAGLREAVMPVMSGTELLGYVMFGQFRRSASFPEFPEISRFSDAERKKLKKAFRELPVLTDGEMESLSGLMRLLVDYIVQNGLITQGKDYLYSAIEDYLDRNLSREIMLPETARHFGLSVSSLCHFLSNHHTTFKRMLTEKRILHAETLMQTRSNMPIKEIAMNSGFPDPFYFSRIYRKIRGIPPEEFRKRNRS